MDSYPLPSNEAERLAALISTGLLDSEHEAVFDAVVALAASICGVPIAAISLLDQGRQWFKASVGLDDRETPRSDAFCTYTILDRGLMEVRDALDDARFRHNRLVLGAPDIRFYAGVPLITGAGHALGALCVIDRAPRVLDADQRESLKNLATVVERLIDARSESLRQQQILVDNEAELQRSSDEILRSRDFIGKITDAMPALVLYLDRDERIRFVNAAVSRRFGGDPHKLIGTRYARLCGEALYAEVAPYVVRTMAGEQVEFEGSTQIGEQTIHYRSHFLPDRDLDGEISGMFAMTFDLTALKLAEARLRHLAEYDVLTGIANRARLYDLIERSRARAKRHGTARALLYLDVDRFKAINDSLGHAGGDSVLIEFAQRLVRAVRATDTVARLAGDEFVVLLEDLQHDTDAEHVADAIIAAMRTPVDVGGRPVAVATSIGIARSRDPDETADDLLRRADAALYAAKSGGRNAWRVAEV